MLSIGYRFGKTTSIQIHTHHTSNAELLQKPNREEEDNCVFVSVRMGDLL